VNKGWDGVSLLASLFLQAMSKQRVLMEIKQSLCLI
jgi:hypothetical protein